MSMKSSSSPEFSRLKAALWPVHSGEYKKLIPMLLIFFLISFNYNILRVLKDACVITAESSGAEVIPFIKVWAMFPGSIAMTFLFTRLSNRYSRETVFYIMMGIFLFFFFAFAFLLYPFRESLHLHKLADSLQEVLPLGCKGLLAMLRYWSYTLFYVMAELWGVIIFFVLLWGFVNQITQIHEAKRFYGLFGIGANFSGVAAGFASMYVCGQSLEADLSFSADIWGSCLMILIGLILISGLLSLFLFHWLNTNALKDLSNSKLVQKDDIVKAKMSLRESFKYLFRSRYLLCITFIVIAYNSVINLVEVVWKHEMKELFPDPQHFNYYMSQVQTITGVLATAMAWIVSGNSIRKFGWTFTAMLTPLILLITSVIFFVFFFYQNSLSGLIFTLFGTSPLVLTVFLGSFQNIVSRSAKYAVFDATKEMAFVPLTSEHKLKGKAAIDGICSRLGKSTGSIIHQGLLLFFVTITASAPYVFLCLLVMIAMWMMATSLLGKEFKEMTSLPVSSKQKSVLEVKLQEKNVVTT